MRLASRMELIGTETAFEAAARARALEATGREVIHLEIGEPDFDTPGQRPRGRQAAPSTPATPTTRRSRAFPSCAPRSPPTTPPARASPSTPTDVFVTVGGKGVMYYAIMALVDPGDEVIVPDPGYPIYASRSPASSAARRSRSRSARRTTSGSTSTSWSRSSRRGRG